MFLPEKLNSLMQGIAPRIDLGIENSLEQMYGSKNIQPVQLATVEEAIIAVDAAKRLYGDGDPLLRAAEGYESPAADREVATVETLTDAMIVLMTNESIKSERHRARTKGRAAGKVLRQTVDAPVFEGVDAAAIRFSLTSMVEDLRTQERALLEREGVPDEKKAEAAQTLVGRRDLIHAILERQVEPKQQPMVVTVPETSPVDTPEPAVPGASGRRSQGARRRTALRPIAH